jgi:predicted ArsR family transcriptional regulator
MLTKSDGLYYDRDVSVAAVENLLKAPRSAIIDLLKSRGGASVEELAQELAVTKVCVRRHLSLLESDGLIRHEEQRHERGRPRHIYRLTEKADCLFPRRYDEFARGILGQLEREYGLEALERLLAARADELIDQAKRLCVGLNFEQSVRKLTQWISDKGYAAEARRMKDGSFRLVQHNCPTENIATAYPQVCAQELRVYTETLGCQVVRECRISDGAAVCEYRILPPVKRSLRVLPNR